MNEQMVRLKKQEKSLNPLLREIQTFYSSVKSQILQRKYINHISDNIYARMAEKQVMRIN